MNHQIIKNPTIASLKVPEHLEEVLANVNGVQMSKQNVNSYLNNIPENTVVKIDET